GYYYADGYQQQRNGVKIDSVVAPTIQGIHEGKDEILLAALDCISGTDSEAVQPFTVSVYPNPATSGSVMVSVNLSENSGITLSLIDLSGKMILQEIRSCPAGEQTFVLDLQNAAPGFYLLKTQTRNGSAVSKLAVR
ncbi:MAG: T9SS type A sorting domain-containing protein, partial [Bacteroidia bacterium]|nr:T9SS type A sorting domain-containing protein [Bacteroidia bacterium]